MKNLFILLFFFVVIGTTSSVNAQNMNTLFTIASDVEAANSLYDTNADGKIDADEAVQLAEALDKTTNWTAQQTDYVEEASNLSTFQKLVVIIAHQKDNFKDEAWLLEEFRAIDVNGNGVTVAELVALETVLTQQEATDMINVNDHNNNGVMDFPEYVDLRNNTWTYPTDAVDGSFESLDKDGDGLITVNELHYITNKSHPTYTMADATEQIQGFDANGDGKLGFLEHYAFYLAWH